MERLCLMLGSALVLAAVCLYVYDRLEDARAGAQAASAVSQLRQSQSIAAVSETEQPADSAESLPTEDAESGPEPVGTLIQTGQLLWPVPVLAGGGIALVAAGLWLSRKRRHDA